jgi:hypothetical protein
MHTPESKELLEAIQNITTNVSKAYIIPYEEIVIKSLAAAGNYAAEDVMCENATTGQPWLFPNMALKPGGWGRIIQAQAFWETTALTPKITIYLYNKLPTCELRDNVLNTGPLAADLPFYRGRIDLTALEDLGGMSETIITPSTYGNAPLYYQCANTSNYLYGVVVLRDAVTDEAAGAKMHIRLVTERY